MSLSQSKPALKLDWCNYEAAKYAVEHWHYSRRMPRPPMVRIGVWEGGRFVGCVIFARGNTPTLGNAYGLGMTQVAELVRVALTRHETAVSRIIAIALKMLRKAAPELRLVVSFADPAEGHHGGIYQAGGWIYTGESEPSWQWLHNGRWKHNREITSGAFGNPRQVVNYKVLPKRQTLGKHRYLYPLDAEMRARIAPLAKPYPKRSLCEQGEIDSAPQTNAETEGARPICSLPSLDNLQGDDNCA